MTDPAQTFRGDPADVGVVVDNEDARSSGWLSLYRRPRSRRCSLDCPRQVDLHGRPLADAAVDTDRSAGLTHDAEHHGPAQPRSSADLLGRKKGLERVLDDLRAHPGPGVAQRNKDAVTTGYVVRQLSIAGADIRCFDQEGAALRHRVARVDGDIQKRGLDLIDIDHDRPEFARKGLSNV